MSISRGDALVGEPDTLEGSDLLDFAEIPHVHFPVYPVAQHLAEKLHAYTLPRDQENTRVKDLVDMVAIAPIDRVQADALLASLERRSLPAGRTSFPTNCKILQARGDQPSRGLRASRRPLPRLSSTRQSS